MRLKSATDRDAFNPPTAPKSWPQSQAQPSQSFNDLREQADQQRRLHRRADPSVQDWSYGFGEQNNQPLGRDDRGKYRYNNRRQHGRHNAYGGRRGGGHEAQQTGLYSDEMMVDAPQNGRNRGRR